MNFLYILEDLRRPFWNAVMSAVTQLGGETVFIAVSLIVLWCVGKTAGYYLLTVSFSGTLLNQLLKIVCRVPRPWMLDPDFTIVESARAEATGYSFPSGHAQNVTAVFGGIARWTRRTALRLVCLAVIVLTALSRMYLGVHTPKDVLVSMLLSAMLVFAFYPLFSGGQTHSRRLYALFAAMTVLSGAYCAFVALHPWPADTDPQCLASAVKNGWSMLGATAGMLTALFLDRRFIHYDTAAPWWGQILKVLLGLGLTAALRSVLKASLALIFGASGAADAVRYFLMVVFAGAVWPAAFRIFRRGNTQPGKNA